MIERYKDPVNGKFDDVTASVLKELMSDDESNQESESEMELEVAANDEAGVEPELTQQYYSVEIIMGRGGVLKLPYLFIRSNAMNFNIGG